VVVVQSAEDPPDHDIDKDRLGRTWSCRTVSNRHNATIRVFSRHHAVAPHTCLPAPYVHEYSKGQHPTINWGCGEFGNLPSPRLRPAPGQLVGDMLQLQWTKSDPGRICYQIGGWVTPGADLMPGGLMSSSVTVQAPAWHVVEHPSSVWRQATLLMCSRTEQTCEHVVCTMPDVYLPRASSFWLPIPSLRLGRDEVLYWHPTNYSNHVIISHSIMDCQILLFVTVSLNLAQLLGTGLQ